MKITAREVAEHLGVDYVVASGLMTALVEKGLAKHVENRKHSSGKGKPTRVFEVNQTITLELFPSNVNANQPAVNSNANVPVFTPVSSVSEDDEDEDVAAA